MGIIWVSLLSAPLSLNLTGALKQWVDNQNQYENYFCVVDLHAITVPHSPEKLRKESLQAAAIYLAAGSSTKIRYSKTHIFIGIDPQKSNIFIQSHVSAHAELAWLLNCITPLSWLERMIQFKEKSANQSNSVSIGLLDYPVLMAADILLYRAHYVPVGEDQRQHLELTREIARRLNELYKPKPLLIEPQGLIPTSSSGARVMSLIDGTSKMSKSHPNDLSRINLLDSPEIIKKKIKKCKTDSFPFLEENNPSRPECENLLNIFHQLSPPQKEENSVKIKVNEMNWGQFKPLLSETIINHLQPIQERYHQIIQDEKYLEEVLYEGKIKAEIVANQTLLEVKEAMGFHSFSRR